MQLYWKHPTGKIPGRMRERIESWIALPVSYIFLLTFQYYFASKNWHPNIKKWFFFFKCHITEQKLKWLVNVQIWEQSGSISIAFLSPCRTVNSNNLASQWLPLEQNETAGHKAQSLDLLGEGHFDAFWEIFQPH